MVEQVYMSPSKALYHWLVDGMSMEHVLSQTGYTRWSDLSADHVAALESEEMAVLDRMMSPDERQREEDVDAVWIAYGDYLKEFVPPYEYQAEMERLLPLIKTARQMHNAARSKPFRDAVKRRRQYQ